MRRYLSTLMFASLACGTAFAQSTIHGTVTEKATGEPIIGANLILLGTTQGDATDLNGEFAIEDVEAGSYTLRVSSVGFITIMNEITVGSDDMGLNFELELTSQSLTALEVFASRSDQETPVAFSNVSQEDIQVQLGSRTFLKYLT